jgi:hypothetical protein
MADDLRACLVALNRQAQVEPSSPEWSLNAWWRWLDDEGYNREAFAEVLQRLGAARISEAQLTNLVTTCGTRGDEPNGLALFQELLHKIDKDSLDLLHHFESIALTEEHELVHEAGGRTNLTKGEKVEIGVGVPLAVFGIVGVGFAVRALLKRCAVVDRDQIMANVDQAARNEARDARQALLAGEQDLRRDVRDVRSDGRNLAGDIIKTAADKPEQTYKVTREIAFNAKHIGEYTAEDIKSRVNLLVSEHTLFHLGDLLERRCIDEFKRTPKFLQKVEEAAAKNAESDFSESNIMRGLDFLDTKPSPDAISKAEASVMADKGWFEKEFSSFRNANETKFRAEEMKKLTQAYEKMLSLEVEAAKKEEREAKVEFNSAFYDAVLGEDRLINSAEGEVRGFAKASEVKVERDIVRIAEKAKAAVRDAKDMAKQELIDIESI